jgi:hypothetical protein
MFAIALLLAGCGGAPATGGTTPVSSGEELRSAGARCQNGFCNCRPTDGSGEKETDPPAAGLKRFELHLNRGLDPTEVIVDGKRALHREPERPEERCAYVDLAPGKHKVQLRVKAKDAPAGFSPELEVNEYGTNTGAWYKTFRFDCHSNEPCIKDDLKAFLDRERATPRGLHDACGSTRVETPNWSADHSPNARLEDLIVDLTLKVYAFAPHEPPGSTQCGHGQKRGATDEKAGDESGE